jgi:MFS family permease
LKNKISILFFILIYFNQGWFDLPSQSLYYLMRESWGLSAGLIGLSGFITGLAWYIKPVWGLLLDFKKLGQNSIRNYLTLSYLFLLIFYAMIFLFGLNFITLIITGLFINCCIGLADVGNDSQMVIYEKKYSLNGKIQSIQWISLGVAGLIVSLLGSKIPDMFSIDKAYRISYLFAMIVPIGILIYLYTGYKEQYVEKKNINWKQIFSEFKNPNFKWSLLFVCCLQLCPSFGTALMIKAREELFIGKMFLGYLGATGTVLGIIGYVLYYLYFHKVDMKRLLYFMIWFTAISNLFYLYIPNQWFLVAYNVIFGAFGGITFMTILAFFAKIVPKGNEGLFYALIASLSNLCARLGSCIGGIVYDSFGYSTNVLISSLLTLFCLVIIPKLQIKKD